MKKLFLLCGILSSLLYVAMNILIPIGFEGYSLSLQTVSELSAIDAPTREVWVYMAAIYILLFAAFGIGVLKSSDANRRLKIAGILIMFYCIVNIYWPPMHLRGYEPTLTDTLHIVWSMIAVVFMLLIMGFGSAAIGKSFRIYTILSMVLLLVFGYLTGLEAPNIPLNLPTPMIGVWERILIFVYLLWVVVFAVVLLRAVQVKVEV